MSVTLRSWIAALAALVLASGNAWAANSTLSALTASGALAGANTLYVVQTPGAGGVKATMTQVGAFTYGLMSGDATASGTGAITFATVNANVGSFGSTTSCASFTVNAKGLITAASAATCAPAIGSVTGLGTGVATALGVNIGTAGAPVVLNGAGGTPSAITLTNGTGLPISTGVSGLATGVATFLGTPSSVNLRAALTDETGTGLAYFQGGALGTPASGVATNLTGTAAGLTAGTVTTNANLTGDVTSVGNATTLTNAPVIAKVLTGFTSGAGTVSAADSILSAFQKINGNDALKLPLAGGTMSGNVAMGGNAITGGGAITGTTLTASTSLTLSAITGSTQCLNVNTSGLVSGTGSACGGSGSTGANPTATASDVAVNGVATTFMRSDAAPPVQKTSSSVFGLVKVDGTSLTASAGVASVNAGCGVSTAGGSVAANASINAQVGTTYTVLAGDCGQLVSFTNASPVAVTLPQATGSFTTGWYSAFINLGAGTVTITPTTSTIDGAASITLLQFQSIDVISNGTNYITARGRPTNVDAAQITAGTVAAARGGFGTDVSASSGVPLFATGTPTFTSTTGTGNFARATSPTFVTPVLGTPTSVTLTNATGLPIAGITGLGTNVGTALGTTLSAAGGLSTTVASGTSALGTGAITSATCATVVTTTATNTATTDVIWWGFNGDPTAVTGYVPATAGMLTIVAYPSANNVNFKVCNNTSSSVTPGAITLNWRVVR